MSFRTSSSESERAFERVRRSWVRNSVRAGRSCVRPPVLDLNAAYSPMECCDSSPLSLPLPMARITEILSARFPHEGKESRNQFPHSQIRKRCSALQRLGANDHLVEWPQASTTGLARSRNLPLQRTNRIEPRAIKRRPIPHDWLTKPRETARSELLTDCSPQRQLRLGPAHQ